MFLKFIKISLVALFFSFTLANFGSVFRSDGFNLYFFDIVTLFSCLLLALYIIKKHYFSVNLSFLIGNLFGLMSFIILILSHHYFNFDDGLKSFFYLGRFLIYFYNSYFIYILLKEREISINFLKKLFFGNFIFLIILILVQIVWFNDLYSVSNFGYDPHFGRVVGSFLDPNFLGFYLVLYLWIATFIFPNAFVSFTSFFLILATQSRSSFLTLFLFLGLWFLIKRKLMPLIFALLAIGFVVITPMLQRFEHISKSNDSINLRLQSFENGFLIAQFSDYMGIGFNNYKTYQKTLGLLEESRLNTNFSNFNDSSFISIYVFSGFLGILIFVIFLATFLKNDFGIMLICLILFNSNMNNSLFYPPTSFTILLLLFITVLGNRFFINFKT